MSRKASRASNAARRKTIAARRERTAEISTEQIARTERSMSAVATRPAASDARIWNAMLVGGAAVTVGLLGRQIVDIVQDRTRPAMMQNDIYSALGSVALLVIIGVFAYNRRRLLRTRSSGNRPA